MKLCKRGGRDKVIFRTILDAKIALAKRMHDDRGEIRFYKCGNHYHLTSQVRNHISEGE